MSEHVRRKVAQERRERAQRWRNEALSLPSRLGAFSGIFGFAILGFLAYLVRDASPLLATVLAIASVIVLFLPVVDRYRNGPQSPTAKRWRGRDMDVTYRPPGASGQPAWFEHLRDTLPQATANLVLDLSPHPTSEGVAPPVGPHCPDLRHPRQHARL